MNSLSTKFNNVVIDRVSKTGDISSTKVSLASSNGTIMITTGVSKLFTYI